MVFHHSNSNFTKTGEDQEIRLETPKILLGEMKTGKELKFSICALQTEWEESEDVASFLFELVTSCL